MTEIIDNNDGFTSAALRERMQEIQSRRHALNRTGVRWSNNLDTICPNPDTRGFATARVSYLGTPWHIKFIREIKPGQFNGNESEVFERRRYVMLQVDDSDMNLTHIDINFTPWGMDTDSFDSAQAITGYTDDQLIELVSIGTTVASTEE